MRNLVLIGMPGCGKSTVGVLAAKALGYHFLDTDLLLQRQEGCRLQEIIDGGGLSAFLAAEERALCAVEGTHTVIATGGSAVYSEKGMAHLAAGGRVLWLRADCAQLAARLGDYSARGIAGAGEMTLCELAAAREPLYRRWAEIVVDCTDGIEDTLARLLDSLRGGKELEA